MNEQFVEELEAFIKNEKLNSTEGSSGVKNLCAIVEVLGYKDSQYFGQHDKGSYGSLINFLEDNSGAVEAIIEFIKDYGPKCEDWSQDLPTLPKEFVWDDEGVFICGDPDIQLATINKDGEVEWCSLGIIQEAHLEVTEETISEAKEWYKEQKEKA